ncbi:hypothetical protein MNBD_GAMMA06-2180 [hydrothermal vent metagenome]|uniref:Amine oxidase domain-containing protein n=1 Tax=hydrothermal vent metagenome TaxID=652676 RepID=A0A3B0WIT9_9ZZZZ
MPKHHSTIIIGAGLSGLYAAWKLYLQKKDVIVLEARERSGGRILSDNSGAAGNNLVDSNIDLGPSWIWPQFQPRLTQLINHLGLSLFKQFTQGDKLYETDGQNCERYNDQSAHSDSYRIVGGGVKLVNELISHLPESTIKLNTKVIAIKQLPLSVSTLSNGQMREYTADKIILAMPPRLSEQSIEFTPPLSTETKQLWRSTPTWMAAHSKVVFIYDKPFWREQNLSGEVFSHIGPLSEIYDGSPANEEYFALTCFVGLNANQRKQIPKAQFKTLCLAQLNRLFGKESQQIKHTLIKDWSFDNFTANETDINAVAQHPQFPANATRTLWDGKLILAGSEVAREHGGYLEGALESADEAFVLV